MADFKYKGGPTKGKPFRDVKVPKSDGTFEVFTGVIPNASTITVTDSKSIEYLRGNSKFQEQ